jgi:hypothetical protein
VTAFESPKGVRISFKIEETIATVISSRDDDLKKKSPREIAVLATEDENECPAEEDIGNIDFSVHRMQSTTIN